MAQLQDVQQLQAAAAAADARAAAAADERADSERIKTREALSQCKVKQQQHRQLLLSLGRDLRQLIVDQQPQQQLIVDQQTQLSVDQQLIVDQQQDMLLAQVLLKEQLAAAEADAAAVTVAVMELTRCHLELSLIHI